MNELYQQLDTCLKAGDICEELQAEIEQRQIAIEQRQYDKTNRCPEGYIEYCDSRMRGCGAVHKSPDDKYACITPGQYRDIFKGIW